ncbi:S66 peptidase family protein [Lentilitoribacter sp. EG35]|uniref:S66 peptidase family protein n=1 Tax=Lentilitoribacter sp. EG35 TaxID=3234192 RepID=UPI00345F698D
MIPVRRFNPGSDQIGVICPSDSIKAFPRRRARAVANLEKLTSSKLVFARHAMGALGKASGSARNRTQDLEEMLVDPSIGMIMAATGGYSTVDVVDQLDIDLVRAHAKPIIGFSDVTMLLNHIYERTGCITFHGPALLPNFGSAEPPIWQGEVTLSTMAKPTAGMYVKDPQFACDSFQFWDQDDDNVSPQKPVIARKSIGRKPVEGPLIGGNLDTLVAMAAARMLPESKGALIFIEAAFGFVEKAARDLKVLELGGFFNQANGLIVGIPFQIVGGERLQTIVEDLASSKGLSLLSGLSIGHTSPITIMPIGATARLDPEAGTLMLIEDVTR